jgi:predicted Zn-dependent protease with MMP-like domain
MDAFRPTADDPDRPPGPVDFDEVIDAVIDDLPEAFAARLGSVAIVVEDEASADQLASVGAHGLFGLYQGVPRTRFGVDNVPLPSKITLFRGSLSRAHPGPERLTRAIEDTLLHEIAHHFGIDDARLHELRDAGRASRISSADRADPHPGAGPGS